MEHPRDDTARRRLRRGTGEVLASERHRERERTLAAAHRQRHTPRYRSVVLHWMGRWLRRPRPVEPAPVPPVEPGQVAISFGGHATVLIRYASLTVACDPVLGRWVKGIKREVAPGLAVEDLSEVDLILISHSHADHLHRPTLARLPRSATVVVPPRTAHRISHMGFARVVELEVGQSIQHRGVDVTTAAVRHGDRALSYVLRGDGPSVYFCGDSGYFSGFADIGRTLAPDIALLPISGYAPRSFRDQHMSPLDALYALEDLRARVMIPIHHSAFALSYERIEEPRRWLAELVRERNLEDFVVELAPGESRLFVPPRRRRRDLNGGVDAVERATTAGQGPHTAADHVGGLAEAMPAVASGMAQRELPNGHAAARIEDSGLHATGTPAWVSASTRRKRRARSQWALPEGTPPPAPAWVAALHEVEPVAVGLDPLAGLNPALGEVEIDDGEFSLEDCTMNADADAGERDRAGNDELLIDVVVDEVAAAL
ncbi:MBL fold metallo-hydrolase [Haliangium sp.]|uniref:MBL fold metallo-hydrolase n=1 Tax=Haliangium sp. TaxID=2663208 RepID=UPI003D14BA19